MDNNCGKRTHCSDDNEEYKSSGSDMSLNPDNTTTCDDHVPLSTPSAPTLRTPTSPQDGSRRSVRKFMRPTSTITSPSTSIKKDIPTTPTRSSHAVIMQSSHLVSTTPIRVAMVKASEEVVCDDCPDDALLLALARCDHPKCEKNMCEVHLKTHGGLKSSAAHNVTLFGDANKAAITTKPTISSAITAPLPNTPFRDKHNPASVIAGSGYCTLHVMQNMRPVVTPHNGGNEFHETQSYTHPNVNRTHPMSHMSNTRLDVKHV